MNQYPSIWKYKPWWCQPWSILLTGISIIAASWLLLQVWWLTVAVTLVILIWWLYFLVIWPNLLEKSGILQELAQETSLKSN